MRRSYHRTPKITGARVLDHGLSWCRAPTRSLRRVPTARARAGDLLGRRRVFVVGSPVHVSVAARWLASRHPGCSARASRDRAAIAAPSTLALLQISFPRGSRAGRAIGAYSAVAGGGGSVGLVLGGMLTSWCRGGGRSSSTCPSAWCSSSCPPVLPSRHVDRATSTCPAPPPPHSA